MSQIANSKLPIATTIGGLSVNLNHLKMRSVTYELCSKQCRSLREFMSHFKDDHRGGKLTCSYCDKTFSSWSGRYNHEHLHDTTSTATIICMICGRAFHYNNELTKHMAVHNDDLRHACATCDKSFASKGSLKRHEVLHQNLDFPCQAQGCTRSFNTSEKLQRHFRGFHGTGYTTLCQIETFQWPGKRQRHQKNCTACDQVRQERESKRFPDLRSS